MPRNTKNDNILGRRLRECRGTKPAREIAAMLGISQQAYTAWERGSAEPSCSALVKLAKHHKVSADWLLGISNVTDSPSSRADTVQVLTRMVEIEAKAQQERQALLAMLCPS